MSRGTCPRAFLWTALIGSCLFWQLIVTNTALADDTYDLVFIGQGYDLTDTESRNKYESDVERFREKLLEFEPFKSRQEQLGFHTIPPRQILGVGIVTKQVDLRIPVTQYRA